MINRQRKLEIVDNVTISREKGKTCCISDNHGVLTHNDQEDKSKFSRMDGSRTGAGLNLSDWNTWNKYKCSIESVNWSNKYSVSITLVVPHCSLSELRQFRIMGVDLIIGYESPSDDRFIKMSKSVVIDGYWNSISVDLNHYNPGNGVTFTIDLASSIGHPNGDTIRTRNRGVEYVTTGSWDRVPLTWEKLHSLIRGGGNIFFRPWVRTAHFCNGSYADQDSTNGFLYAGYDNFNNPGREGHTFNNGILLSNPIPFELYGTAGYGNPNSGVRIGDADYNSATGAWEENTGKIKIRTIIDNYANVFRAPSSGTSATMTWVTGYKLASAQYDIGPIFYYPDGSYKHSDNIRLGASELAPNGKVVINRIANVFSSNNTVSNTRINCSQQTVIQPNGWVIDYGGGHYAGPYDRSYPIRLSAGTGGNFDADLSFRKDQYLMNTSRPVGVRSLKDAYITRYDNIMNPYQNNVGWSNMQTSTGEGLHEQNQYGVLKYRWLVRSYATIAITGKYSSYDYELPRVRDANIYLDSILNNLYTIYPSSTNLEYTEFGIDHASMAEFTSGDILRRTNFHGWSQGWTGYKFESPVTNIRSVNALTHPATFVDIEGQKVEINNNFKLRVDCNSRSGTNKVYNIGFGLCETVEDMVNGYTYYSDNLIGIWHSDFNQAYANGSTSNISAEGNWIDKVWNMVKGDTNKYPRKSLVRAKYVNTFTQITTKGRWIYGNDWIRPFSGRSEDLPSGTINSNPSAHSYRFYVPVYPDCKLTPNSVSYDTEHMAYSNSIIVTDVNKGTTVFKIKEAWLEVSISGYTSKHRQVLSSNVNSRSYTATVDSNITNIVKSICGIVINGVGKTITYALHANGNYPLMDTSDGTRDGNRDGSTTVYQHTKSFDIVPNITLSCETKGESFNFNMAKGSYPATATYDVAVKVTGTSAWTTIKTGLTNNQTFAYNPGSNFNISERGKMFDVRIYSKGTHGAIGYIYIENKFRWNEIPSVNITSVTTGQDGTGYETINWVGSCGNKITAVTKLTDGDTNTISHFIKYGTNKACGSDSLAANGTLTKNITADNMAATISGLYPIDLTQYLSYAVNSRDSFNQTSTTKELGRFKMLTPIKRSNYKYEAVSGYSSKEGDTVHGVRVDISYSLSHVNTSKFNDTDWFYIHNIYARGIGESETFHVKAFEHSGSSIPASLLYNVDLQTSSGFVTGKKYEFIAYTRVTRKVNGVDMSTSSGSGGGLNSDNRIYETSSSWFGKVSYGTKPLKPTIMYPLNNSTFNCMNPSLVISLPAQTDPTNSELEIGFDKSDGNIIWQDLSAFGNDASPKTIRWVWATTNGTGSKIYKIYLRSKISKLISDVSTTTVNITSLNLAKSSGESLVILSDIRNEVNRLRSAYGLANATFESNSTGNYITFNNAITTILDGYNAVINKINSYPGNISVAPMNISNNTHIFADATDVMHNKLKVIQT